MGFRFRDVISFGPYLRINVSKSGIGVGIGPRGLSMSLGSAGLRKSVGIPGSGMSYQETTGWKQLNKAAASASPGSRTGTGIGMRIWKVLLISMMAVMAYKACSSNKTVSQSDPVRVVAPEPNRALSAIEMKELQTLLNQNGFNAGIADGIVGAKTNRAVKAFLKANPAQSNIPIDLRLLEQLRKAR
jgi:hypothetical protein